MEPAAVDHRKLRTALILATVAIALFIGIIARYWLS
jgi:hypothetical protein